MKDRTALAWLNDARRYTLDAYEMTSGLSSDAFATHRPIHFAVRYCLAVIGEALNQVPKDVRALAPDIPWTAIYNLRNRLIHGFWLVDADLVLRIVQNDTVPLAEAIERLADKLK
jgi:uncharacterized protein with HEPN domain